MRIHFIAIGGAGMSVVAELLLAAGHDVQGSDQRESTALDRLRGLGARVWVGHDADHVAGADLVVISTAIRENNVELVAARAGGIEVIHRSEALAMAAADADFVAVAGAHGKTSTSGMLAVALREAGLDPGFAVGAIVVGVGSGAHAGTGPFVAEADESDGSFLNYRPRIGIVTNIEPDHLDHYGSVRAVYTAFEEFAGRIVPGGLLIACADDIGSAALAALAAARGIRACTYGTSPGADVRLEHVHSGAGSASAVLTTDDLSLRLDLAVPGEHNVLNAAAAWCAGVELGVSPVAMADALATFGGTSRRFETKGEVGGIRVIDDYAHHPTEVTALLRTARQVAGPGRVLAVFQPHLFSRTAAFAAEFAGALALADEAFVLPIYPAREEPQPGVTSALITDAAPALRPAASFDDAVDAIRRDARPGDLVLTIGAGDVTALGPRLVASLRAPGRRR
ncbi:UDP-N-acetylmuramate--L-alanine ligase [Pseudactinotalea sp. HY160]|uniref:UDP-N-acetylmuramate--L-alanine ligase n=1 Tax=Pseudactinotalea sp. HY160 TaxID=2654490 RepID=UPI00128B271E|nr:UDP-N-acetylmuramate--L-alanine ligase [Pseudactinotalea sp. HY160]MPV49518.1 UDP-N-acetylmuramate--L-alanine ligase [Pseudactinotalea sp. HY160]